MEKKTSATLATIAAAAGYSVSTVSRALQKNKSLPARTIARIQRIADEQNYHRNALVTAVMSHLRSGKVKPRGTLAYLVFGASRTEWQQHLTFVGFFEGAKARARDNGFGLEQFWADEPAMTPARLRQILLARGIKGVVLGPTVGLPATPHFDWTDLAPVKIGVPYADLPLPCATTNHFRSMVMVIERLQALGYKRLGLVLQEHQNIKTAALWLAPLIYHGQHLRPADRVTPLVMKQWRETDFRGWFNAHRPQVVIGLRSELITWMTRLGVKVPGDVGFVHLDCCTEPGSFAGIDQKPREVGAAAIDMVASLLLPNTGHPETTSRQLLVDGVWVDGPTLRPLEKTTA